MKAKPTTPPPVGKPQPATRGEINQAIRALTQEDTERIEQAALNRIDRIRRAANRRSHEDLIQEAFTRMLDGTRHWYRDRGVTFAQCLIGAIWSIASEWAGHRNRNKEFPEYAQLESDLSKTDEQGRVVSPFDGLQEPSLNAEEEMIEADASTEREAENRALVERIEATFEDDEDASILLLGFQDGMDGPAIRAEFGISEKEFGTTMRRIQRGVRKMMDENHDW
jgi:DNA-directed RNA polymerase specialized sigma24 family protein